MSAKMTNADEKIQGRFCALEYRPQGGSDGSPQVASIIVLVLEDEQGKLRFLVHPQWRGMVSGTDLSYLESLFKDFIERAKLHPAALFQQLSSLGVGPLVTQEAGTGIADHSPLLKLCSRFVQL
jgi:hypothetical protein